MLDDCVMAINPDAAAFFAAHPDEPYWYYNQHIRVPNPKLVRHPMYEPAPWPDPTTLSNHLADRR